MSSTLVLRVVHRRFERRPKEEEGRKKRIRVDDDDAEEEENRREKKKKKKKPRKKVKNHVQVVRSVWVLTRFFFPRRNDLKSALLS